MQDPQVVSSLEDQHQDLNVRLPRQNRLLLPTSSVVTVTLTTTSYNFVTTVVKKAISLYVAPAPMDGVFTCVPPGYGVC